MARTSNTCVIACYFNSTNSRIRKSNFSKFYSRLIRANIPVYIIELVFEGAQSALEGEVENLHVVKSGAILWQKERLLNRLVAILPEKYTKVVWTDVDMIFGSDPNDWLLKVSDLLEDYVAIQGFAAVDRRPRFGINLGKRDIVDGFAKVLSETEPGQPISGNYRLHGHTGYTWAARRDFLQDCGFYDCCMSGSGDHLMAHALCGDFEADCFDQVFQNNSPYRDHFLFWAERAASKTKGRIGFVDCTLQHLWHGSPKNRRYRQRDNDLTASHFNPSLDLMITKAGSWDWSPAGQRFVPWARDYFHERQER